MRILLFSQSVGPYCPNLPQDVKAVHQRLMDIGKIPCYSCSGVFDDTLLKGIKEVQRHFMLRPDGVISIGGRMYKALTNWMIKPISPGAQLPGHLHGGWRWGNPFLSGGRQ